MELNVLYLLIPASVLLALVALALFVWAIHTGQFDDLETPAVRVLFDDGTQAEPPPAVARGPAPNAPATAASSAGTNRPYRREEG